MMYAHRIAYEVNFGPIPEGMQVCHRCDRPQCVNPEHLFLGTIQDNMRDMREKGRSLTGERNTKSKLSEPIVLGICRMSEAGVSQKSMADMFGVSRQTISSILTGRTWSSVTGKKLRKSLDKPDSIVVQF